GFDGIRASGFRKSRAYLLRRLTAITVFLQISHRPKRPAALADGALKQSLGQRRSDQRINAPRTRRFAEDGHATGIATEGRDVLLRPHVQVETILALFTRRRVIDRAFGVRRLRTIRAEGVALPDAFPRPHGLRSFPAQFAHRRRRERYAFVAADAVDDRP